MIGDYAHLRKKHGVSVALQRESCFMVVAEPWNSGLFAKTKFKHRETKCLVTYHCFLKFKELHYPDRGLKIPDLSQRYFDYQQCRHLEEKLTGKTQTPIENRLNRIVNIVYSLVIRDRLQGVQPASLDYILNREPERY